MPGKAGRFDQSVLVAGEHRDTSSPGATNVDHHPAGSFDDVVSVDASEIGANEARPRSQTDQPAQTLAAGLGGLVVGQGEVGVDLCLGVGSLRVVTTDDCG